MATNKNIANEVIHNLWLGDAKASQSREFIKAKNINCIINCTVTSEFLPGKLFRYKYRIPVKDNCEPEEISLMYSILDKTADIIYRHLQNGDVILVHCHAGRQRSVSIILAFIMKYACMSFNKSLILLKTKRSVSCYPDINFHSALLSYEKHLRS
jgi:protein-tyrosine phosphatase